MAAKLLCSPVALRHNTPSSPVAMSIDSLRYNLQITMDTSSEKPSSSPTSDQAATTKKAGTKRKRDHRRSEIDDDSSSPCSAAAKPYFKCEFCSKEFKHRGHLRVHAKSREFKGSCPKDSRKKKCILPVIVNEGDDSSDHSAATTTGSGDSDRTCSTTTSSWLPFDDSSNPELDRDYEIFSVVRGEDLGKDVTKVVVNFDAY